MEQCCSGVRLWSNLITDCRLLAFYFYMVLYILIVKEQERKAHKSNSANQLSASRRVMLYCCVVSHACES